MDYISTRNKSKIFSFKEIFLKGLAPDGGLFIPKKIPLYSLKDLEKLRNLSYKELASKIIFKFCSKEFKENEIKNLINKSYKNFRTIDVVKLKKIGDLNLLELFHGPTLAFKDIAMQVIGNMYEKILEKEKTKINIVVATSGDTGAAAISAIKNRKNMKVFVLHPKNKISDIQRKFMTTENSVNVFNLALNGNFDDCQKLVKSMFADSKFRNSINMSGVNSINWSRIVFQIVYYFFAYFQIAKKNEKINFSVPTGNFGDVYAGYIAKKMGLPINKLLIATNKNDILKRVIDTGIYKPQKVKQTISPSMDIQVASNFERLIFDICSKNSTKTIKFMKDLKEKGKIKFQKKEHKKLKENFLSESVDDNETKLIISKIYKQNKKLIDPHTAVGIGAVKKSDLSGNTIILATAHPFKFSNIVLKETGSKPTISGNLKDIILRKEKFDQLNKNIEDVKKYILERI